MVLSPQDRLKRLNRQPIVSSKIFQLLPEFLRDPNTDPKEALKVLFGAVQEEFDRNKQLIDDIIFLVDPLGVGNRLTFQGSPILTGLDQILGYGDLEILPGGSAVPSTATTIGFNTLSSAVPQDNFYVGFGLFLAIDEPSDPNAPSLNGQYRKVVGYNGTTKVATVSPAWSGAVPNSGIILLAYPDRISIPTTIIADPNDLTSGTLLPNQDGVSGNQVRLPGRIYISTLSDAYIDYTIEILDGLSKGEKRTITAYSGSSLIATLSSNWSGTVPQERDWFQLSHPIKTSSTTENFYKGKYVRILSGPADLTGGYSQEVQTRKIIRSEFRQIEGNDGKLPATQVLFVSDSATGEGQDFDVPPDPTSFFGITSHFVSLLYLARQLGYTLDALDPEELQREQLRQAFNFYKLKGTRKAFELIIESFGLKGRVEEQVSNYTRPPDPIGVGPEFCEPPHIQTPWPPAIHIAGPKGIEDLPCAYLTSGRDTARIPDSDIKIFVKRINPKLVFAPDILRRILTRLEEVRPIHVEIILIGFLEDLEDVVETTELLNFDGIMSLPETFNITDSLASVVAGLPQQLVVETADFSEEVLITSDARWDSRNNRWDDQPAARWDSGKVYFRG